MNERRIPAKDKPFMMGFSSSVYYRRRKYPQEMTLYEAIEISKTLKFTEEEIYRVIYGKSRESAEKKIGVSIANDIMQTIAQITARQTVWKAEIKMKQQITIRLPDELKKEIQQQADYRGITKSNLIRSIIFRYLQNIFQE